MIIDNKLYCVIYTLSITDFNSVVPTESIYDFILCNNGEEFYFIKIDYNTDKLFAPYIVIDEMENITDILKNITLLTIFANSEKDMSSSLPGVQFKLNKDYYSLFTLNDLLTIGEKIDLKNYSYKIKKSFKPVTYHIDMDNEPINITI
jgi:hypothetical protein